MGQRKAEREYKRARVIQIIVSNGNTLTYAQIKRRIPSASEKMIYDAAKELGVRLPSREYLSSSEMDPHRMTIDEAKDRARRATWPRDGQFQRDETDWGKVWREIE